jgi:putative transposase
MAKKKVRKINSKTVRKMLTWAHSRFRARLSHKAEELGKQVSVVSEAYTSKTCSRCGWIHQKLGGRKVFKCGRCGLEIDRDVNGARGIFLRALLDGAVALE